MVTMDRVFRKNGGATRPKPPHGGGSGSGRRLLQQSDFTYLGAYRVPRDPMSGVQSVFGNGLALRRESSDSTNPVHLLSAGFEGTYNHAVYEWRDQTPTTGGGSPTDQGNYADATVLKQYGDVYSGKKLVIYQGGETPLTQQLDGDLGLYWDDADSRLYWSYGFGYSSDANSWCVGYSTLNYPAGTGAGNGPWRLYNSGSGQSWKAMQAGLVGVPSAYATTYLSGKRLAVGMGGYYSLIADCDCSLGPSLTAFDALAGGAAEKTDLASTPLAGYWPHAADPGAGKGRCNRPENATALGVGETWGLDKFSWNDRVRGGVWIDTPGRYGVLFFGEYGRGRTQYLSSQIPSSRHGHYWAIYDPYGFAPSSANARYAVQPADVFDYPYPTIDYTQTNYAQGPPKSVSGITSTAVVQSTNTGCTVNCTGHGFSNGDYLEIQGASRAEYNEIWEIPSVFDVNDGATSGAGSTTLTSASGFFTFGGYGTVVGCYLKVASGTNFVPGYYRITAVTNDTTLQLAASPTPSGAGSGGMMQCGGLISADAFLVRNTSSSNVWSGTSPAGTITAAKVDNSVDRTLGAVFDPVSNKLYVAVSVTQGVNGLGSHVMIHVYQVP